jgi:hypothetical protein
MVTIGSKKIDNGQQSFVVIVTGIKTSIKTHHYGSNGVEEVANPLQSIGRRVRKLRYVRISRSISKFGNPYLQIQIYQAPQNIKLRVMRIDQTLEGLYKSVESPRKGMNTAHLPPHLWCRRTVRKFSLNLCDQLLPALVFRCNHLVCLYVYENWSTQVQEDAY